MDRFTRLKLIFSPTVFAIIFVTAGSMSSDVEDRISGFCFKMPNVTLDFEGALRWCENRNDSYTLVNVDDNATQTALTQFMKSHNATWLTFINMKLHQILLKWNQTHDVTSWFLINGDPYNGGVVDQNGHKFYGYVNRQGFVSASNAKDTRNFICEYNNVTHCQMNNSFVYNGSCFVKYENENLTWYKARENCVLSGGDLATFNYDQRSYDNKSVPFNASILSRSPNYWVGIRWNNRLWRSPGSTNEVIFTRWSVGHPKNTSFDCVCLDPNVDSASNWVDCDCHSTRKFICYKSCATNASCSAKVSSATMDTPTEPAVTGISSGVGSGVGVFLLILLVILIVVILMRRKRRGQKSDARTTSPIARTGGEETVLYASVVPSGSKRGNEETNELNMVYASVDTKQEPLHGHGGGEARQEIVYSDVEFNQNLDQNTNDTSPYSEIVNRRETHSGQTRNLLPQDSSGIYSNS